MIYECVCGKQVYFLDDECPYCGRDLFHEDDESPEPVSCDPSQMRLFE